MDRYLEAEILLLRRLLYKFKNQMGRRFRVFQRLRKVLKTNGELKYVTVAVDEIQKLLPLGHNLPFLLSSLAILARLSILLGGSEEVASGCGPDTGEEDMGVVIER